MLAENSSSSLNLAVLGLTCGLAAALAVVAVSEARKRRVSSTTGTRQYLGLTIGGLEELAVKELRVASRRHEGEFETAASASPRMGGAAA